MLTQCQKELTLALKVKIYIKTAKKVRDLNKLSKTDKFVGVTVGGGIGTGAVIMKAEDYWYVWRYIF